MQAFNSGKETQSAGRGYDLCERTHTHTFTDALYSNMKLISRLCSRTYAGAAV